MRKQAGTQEYIVSCLWYGGFDLFTVLFDEHRASGFHFFDGSEGEDFIRISVHGNFANLTKRSDDWVRKQHRYVPDEVFPIKLRLTCAIAIWQMLIQYIGRGSHHINL